MLNSALAAIFMWTALFTTQGIYPESVERYPTEYSTMGDCEADALNLKNLINSNDELVDRMKGDGFEGMVILCTDDPNPFGMEE